MIYWVYNLLLTVLLLLVMPVLPFFLIFGQRFRQGFGQRFGVYPRAVRGAVAGSRPKWTLPRRRSGRVSPRAFRHYVALRVFFSQVVRRFTAVGMQTLDDAERMVRLGVAPEKIRVTGSLKHAPWNGNGVNPERAAEVLNALGQKEARQVL